MSILKPVKSVFGVGVTVLGSVREKAKGLVPSPASPPEAERRKGSETPKSPRAAASRPDSAASSEVVATVEEIEGESDVPALPHDELPVPDFDHMSIGSLRGRLRALSVEQLMQLRAYEKAHAARLPIVTMLDNRIAKVSSGEATPTGNVSTEKAPEQYTTKQGGSKVSFVTRGPQQNPPSQGVPTNPAQPRSSGKGSTQW